MRRLTTFIAVIFAAAAFAPLRAQSLDAFKERLAAPVVSDAAFGTARVTVTEYGDAEKAVDDASRVGQRLRLRGYRVCIFFDNGQDARCRGLCRGSPFQGDLSRNHGIPGVRESLFQGRGGKLPDGERPSS